LIQLECLVERYKPLIAQFCRRLPAGHFPAVGVQDRHLEHEIRNLTRGASIFVLHANGRRIEVHARRRDDWIRPGNSNRSGGGEPNVPVDARAGVPARILARFFT